MGLIGLCIQPFGITLAFRIPLVLKSDRLGIWLVQCGFSSSLRMGAFTIQVEKSGKHV